MFNPAVSPMDNNIQFHLRELIRAAEMSGINPQQIPGDANPWSWEDSGAMAWRSNFRALKPAVAQQAETLLGGPLSLALEFSTLWGHRRPWEACGDRVFAKAVEEQDRLLGCD